MATTSSNNMSRKFIGLWVPMRVGSYGWGFEKAIDDFTSLVDTVKLLRERAPRAVEGTEKVALGI
jgi:hypothetical protein